jgi:nucleotide-binding universal stress UspA family protein
LREIVHTGQRREGMTFASSDVMFLKRILVPVDFSLRSRAALGYAVALARQTGAEIEVLHVVPAPSHLTVAVDAYLGLPLPHASSTMLSDAQDRMDALVTCLDHAGVIVHQKIEEGDPAATIVQLATDDAHDLIVLGTHGRVGLAELILGSVAKRLITCAPCPVVTLRAHEAAVP